MHNCIHVINVLFVMVLLFLHIKELHQKRLFIHTSKTTATKSHSVENSLLSYTLISTYLSKKNTISPELMQKYKPHTDCYFLNVSIKSIMHTFCVRKDILVDNYITNKNLSIIVHGHSENDTKTYTLKDLKIILAYGYDIMKPSSSAIDGFIEDNRFYGKIYIDGNTYYLEPIRKFPMLLSDMKKNDQTLNLRAALLYEDKDITLQSFSASDEMKTNMDIEDFIHLRSSNTQRGKRLSNFARSSTRKSIKGHVCPLLLLADYSFLHSVGGGEVGRAVTQMLLLLAEADAIFRNTDFDGDGVPDNVGFTVRYAVVLSSPLTDLNPLVWPNAGPVEGRVFLMRTSKSVPLLKKVCLGAVFTARAFADHALGISFTAPLPSSPPGSLGGICERYAVTQMFNVLAVTQTTENGQRVPWHTAALAFAHELGHSFGSSHDEGNCEGYLMSASSLLGDQRKQYTFSQCSRRQIRSVLNMRRKCLLTDNQPYCGNGLVEADEDCDCGMPLECHARDPCCVPRGAKSPDCRVNRDAGYSCHPSMGLCCTDLCQYTDVSHLGLNCSRENRCPGKKDGCECGLLGQCLGDSCHSTECVRLGLSECSCGWGKKVCGACCLLSNGSCLRADDVTRSLLHGGNVTIDALRPSAVFNGSESYIKRENLCYKGKCQKVFFRVWRQGGFCVRHGSLGQCSHGGVCDVTRPVASIFPSSKLVKSESSSVVFSYRLLVISVILSVKSIIS